MISLFVAVPDVKRLFQRVHDTVTANDSYFQQRPDATGTLGISSLLKGDSRFACTGIRKLC